MRRVWGQAGWASGGAGRASGARVAALARRLRWRWLVHGLPAAFVLVVGADLLAAASGHALAAPRAAGHRVVLARAARRGPAQHFHSEPWLHPALVQVTRQPDLASGDMFLTPHKSAQNGALILDARGQLVWFRAIHHAVFNLEVQRYHGQPVLTWWQGNVEIGHGVPHGEDVILDSSYRKVAVVHAGHGYSADLHEFQITRQGTALLDAYVPARANLSSVGGPVDGTVYDCVIQEVKIGTGRVLWEWHSLRHVPLSASYDRPNGSAPFDYFHLNSIQQLPDGNLLVSARNTWAAYKISKKTGRVIWTLGGKRPSFRMGPGTNFEWQHDVQRTGRIVTVFDDGADSFSGAGGQSSAKVLRLGSHSVTLLHRYTHSPPVLASIEGSVQLLPDGNVFVGWGSAPDFSEYSRQGRQIFNGRFALGVDTYRALRFVWHAHPLTRPSLALMPRAGGAVELWASWNGATDVAAWRVMGGLKSTHLTALDQKPANGFETAILLHDQPRYLAVVALDAQGRALRSSRVHFVPRHLNIFGSRAFVSASSGEGAVPVGCFTSRSCTIGLRVVSGRRTLGRGRSQTVQAGRGKLVSFRLSSKGLRELGRAPNRRLAVEVRIRDASGLIARQLVLIPFSTTGPGPARSFSQSAVLQVVGGTQYVSAGGHGAILTACYALVPCQVHATVTSQGTQIASSQPQQLGVDELGPVDFRLTAAGQSMLAQAPGNQLAAQVTLTSGGQTATGHVALVRYH